MLDSVADIAEPAELPGPSIVHLCAIARLAPGESHFVPRSGPIPFRWQVLDQYDIAHAYREGCPGLVVTRSVSSGVKVERVA